jgi:hypothetical protein
VLKHALPKNGLLSVATLTAEFQTDSGSNVSTITVCWELHEMGFHQWRLLRGGQLIIMAGTEQMEWHSTHGNHVLIRWLRRGWLTFYMLLTNSFFTTYFLTYFVCNVSATVSYD